ncbi:hypothetical protein SASPL_156570 [Salvia splendens]|uniref:1-deoxy-D-xylulose-5-phosphate synthase n=1 Tax=Salvia splendens TaxID=180675 RepID=A0A8X8YVQ2_SALSN|nr:hypothetical protein SASPL_156570 [Salvia splendens]
MASSCGVLNSSFLPLLHSDDSSNLVISLYRSSPLKKLKVFNSSTRQHERRVASGDGLTRQKTRSLNFTGEKPPTPILDTINYPIHMKNLSIEELERLADELREEIVYSVSKTGGHLSSSLGVSELTVALHHVFNTPDDKSSGCGTPAYPHKILTGRRSRMHTIRQTFGLAGFPKRDESAHDAFGAGHSSTSISAGLGMAVGRDLLHKDNHVISVIGDGAMTAGQAYEALNNAGFLDSNLIIVLNDNKQVSLPTATIDGPAPPVGALSKALTRLQASRKFRQLREAAKGVTKQMGEQAHEIASKVDTYMKGMMGKPGASLFEELGIYYLGPVDGHNIEDLGKGYPPAEVAADKMHGVVKFDPITGKQSKSKSNTKSYTSILRRVSGGRSRGRQQDRGDPRSNGGRHGAQLLPEAFPDRCFDVGIAEQHAVTFAAGLATEGLKPFCTIYSSFLQRGYDQVVHDVDLQKLPVRFMMDRAGVVGADGPTTVAPSTPPTWPACPTWSSWPPSDELELMHMIATAARHRRPPQLRPIPQRKREGSRVAILGFGTIVQNCLAAAELLNEHGMSVTVADARFCKPLDGELIKKLVQEHEVLITVEEGSIGGFSAHISHFLSLNGLLDRSLKWRPMVLPDRYIDHGAQTDQIEKPGLSPKHIAATVVSLIGGAKDSLHLINNL